MHLLGHGIQPAHLLVETGFNDAVVFVCRVEELGLSDAAEILYVIDRDESVGGEEGTQSVHVAVAHEGVQSQRAPVGGRAAEMERHALVVAVVVGGEASGSVIGERGGQRAGHGGVLGEGEGLLGLVRVEGYVVFA